MTQPSNRDSIISRVRKLQRFTIANGCSEAEAQAAALKVAEFIAEYNVTQSELSLRDDALHCITDEFIEMSGSVGDWTACAVKVSKVFGTRIWYTHRTEDVLGLGIPSKVTALKFFGLGTDVAASIALTSILYTALNSESSKYRGDRTSFRLGMIDRLNKRLADMVPAQRQNGTGTALMVLKDQLVTDEFAKLNLRLGYRNKQAGKPVNQSAFAAGAAAANRVGLSKTMAAPAARIGAR